MTSTRDFPDYYCLLGIQPTAHAAEIESAYLREIRIWHPDLHVKGSANDREEALRQAVRLNQAFELLKDPTRRQLYDELYAEWRAVQLRLPSMPERVTQEPHARQHFKAFLVRYENWTDLPLAFLGPFSFPILWDSADDSLRLSIYIAIVVIYALDAALRMVLARKPWEFLFEYGMVLFLLTVVPMASPIRLVSLPSTERRFQRTRMFIALARLAHALRR